MLNNVCLELSGKISLNSLYSMLICEMFYFVLWVHAFVSKSRLCLVVEFKDVCIVILIYMAIK